MIDHAEMLQPHPRAVCDSYKGLKILKCDTDAGKGDIVENEELNTPPLS